MNIFNGKNLALSIKKQVAEEIKNLNLKLKLAVILIGNNPASEVYVNNKKKACENVGIEFELIRFNMDCTQTEVVKCVRQLNKNSSITGIILQLPIPRHLSEEEIIESIHPSKDVDCLTTHNFGKLAKGKSNFAPCTASAVLQILKQNQITLKGKNVAVIGRSNLVGKPTQILLTNHNATVTLCHSKTQNLHKITKTADILVVAIGLPKMIDRRYIKKHAVVIDVGINRVGGKLVGDVNFNNVKKKASLITPVPGGVGQITVAMLIKNLLELGKIKKM